jgi:hypothetical protein
MPEPHSDRELHREINLLVSRLDEQQRRWFVALEAKRIGRGGETLLSLIAARSAAGDANLRLDWLSVRPSVFAPPAVDAPSARRRIRSFFRLSKRCLLPRQLVIRWANVQRASAVRYVT